MVAHAQTESEAIYVTRGPYRMDTDWRRPAGLTAAVYLTRFRRTVTVVDGGASRASWIPVSHNLVGFPNGLSGEALLARLREQGMQYGATILSGQVTRLAALPHGGFAAEVDGRMVRAQRVLLATGGLDVEPGRFRGPNDRTAISRSSVAGPGIHA